MENTIRLKITRILFILKTIDGFCLMRRNQIGFGIELDQLTLYIETTKKNVCCVCVENITIILNIFI